MPTVKVNGKTVKFPYTKAGISKAKSVAKEEKGEIKIDKEKGEKKKMPSSDGVYLGK